MSWRRSGAADSFRLATAVCVRESVCVRISLTDVSTQTRMHAFSNTNGQGDETSNKFHTNIYICAYVYTYMYTRTYINSPDPIDRKNPHERNAHVCVCVCLCVCVHACV